MSSDDAFYFYEVSWKYLRRFSSYRADTKLQLSNFKGRISWITPKIYRQEFWFFSSASHLLMLYISMKFHENILKRFFKLQSRYKITNVKFQRGITPKMYRQEIWSLFSAPPLMMLYFSTKFHENILNGFQVIEQTQNCHCQISKGNNSKNV